MGRDPAARGVRRGRRGRLLVRAEAWAAAAGPQKLAAPRPKAGHTQGDVARGARVPVRVLCALQMLLT